MQKLSMSIDEFVKNTPYISEDGAVMLGSKKTTVFEVDLRTGKLIRSYRFDSPSPLQSDEKQSVSYTDTSIKELIEASPKNPDMVDLRLHITRTDYMLMSFARDSVKTSWNMTIAEVGASLLCLDASSGAPLNLPDNLGSEIGIDFAMPLLCHTRSPIFRHRSHILLESSRPERIPGVSHLQGELAIPPSLSDSMLPLPPKTKFHHRKDSKAMLQLAPLGIVAVQSMRISLDHLLSAFGEWSTGLSIMLFTIIVVWTLVVKGYSRLVKEQALLDEQNDSVEKTDKLIDGENKISLHLNKLFDGGSSGRRIGKLFVSTKEIGKGSNGTIVLEGIYEGRPVAIKRLVHAHNDVAFKEIQNLIASDRHLNIVRWYGVEYDQDFVYLALERCTCSLDDLIHIYSDCSQDPVVKEGQATRDMIEYEARLDSLKDIMSGISFWKADGHPSPLLLKLMRLVWSFYPFYMIVLVDLSK